MNNTTPDRPSSTAGTRFTRSLVVALILLMGIGGSLGLFTALRKAAQRELRATFEIDANERAQAIEMTLGHASQFMRDLRDFYGGSRSVERNGFHDYLADMSANHPTLMGVVWTPRVSAVDRAAIEAQAQAEGENGFRILTEEEPGHFTTAPASPEYYPICYAEPAEPMRPLLGRDLGGNPAFRTAMDHARDSGEVIVQSQLHLGVPDECDADILMLAAVYRNGLAHTTLQERRQNLVGFIMAAVDCSEAVESSLDHLVPAGIDVALYSDNQPVRSQLIYAHESPLRLDGEPQQVTVPPPFQEVYTFRLGTNTWTVLSRPTPSFLSQERRTDSWLALLGGLIMTALFAGFAFQSFPSKAVIATKVAERTAELRREVAERKQAQAALRESEAKFLLLTENIQDVFWIRTPTIDRMIYVSPAFERLWGRPCASLYQQPQSFTDAIHSEDLERVIAAQQEHAQGNWNIEYRIITPDGGIRWILDRGYPVRDQRGVLVQMCGVATDITARKRAEAERNRLASILEATTDLVSFSDPAGNILYFNRAARKLLGIGLDEDVTKRSIAEFIPNPSSNIVLTEAVPTAIRQGIWSGETLALSRSGQEIPVSQVILAHKSPDGKLEFLSTIMRDITERKQAEAQRERLIALIEGSPDFIGYAEPKTAHLQFVNASGRKMCGIGKDEDVRKLMISDVHPAWMNKLLAEVVLPAAVRDGLWEGEGAFLNRNGREIPVSMSLMAHKSGNGEVDIFYTVSRDITERNRVEAEKARLEDRLQQARKMESVGRLAGGVAHNFNNVLMGIMNYVELCHDALPPEHAVRAFLDEITGEAQRLADLTRQLLGFARKQTIAPKELDLNAAVSAILEFLRGQNGTEIDTVWHPDPVLWPVKLDAFQVDQALTALYHNACDAIDGAGKITVETANVTLDKAECARHVNATPGEYVRLTVSDTGCGMDQAAVGNLFEPFFTTKDLSVGAGLGLATVYGIVKQNHGFIHVESKPGRGTTFSIFLPRFLPEAAPATVANQATGPLGNGETVLLVDDEKSLRVPCGLFLEALGYTVLKADTPEEALELAERHPGEIRLLLTDVVMPGMGGLQLAQRIRAVAPEVKVLFMSGYTADVIAPSEVLEEHVAFLGKPFTRDDLAHKVREVLGTPEAP